MNTTSLTDRYIAAAMRTVPEKQRADLGAELRTSIDDQIDARVDAGEARDAAERAVLTDLGDPEALAAGYTERSLYLIGPRYYLEWWRLLKILWWIVVPLAALGIALGQVLSGAAFGEIISSAVVGAFTVALHIGFWVDARLRDPRAQPRHVRAPAERADQGRAMGDLERRPAAGGAAGAESGWPISSDRSSSSGSPRSRCSGTS